MREMSNQGKLQPGSVNKVFQKFFSRWNRAVLDPSSGKEEKQAGLIRHQLFNTRLNFINSMFKGNRLQSAFEVWKSHTLVFNKIGSLSKRRAYLA
jgi:hypothetical protein